MNLIFICLDSLRQDHVSFYNPADPVFDRVPICVTPNIAEARELIVANASADQDFTFENCLHTYFHVGDINAVSITGLKGADFLDKTENFARKTERAEHIKISQETDRIYLDTTSTAEYRRGAARSAHAFLAELKTPSSKRKKK